MPGDAGQVIRQIIDATDSPDDPTHWILDQLVAQLPPGSIKNNLQAPFRSSLATSTIACSTSRPTSW
jgi:hypothetical protein